MTKKIKTIITFPSFFMWEKLLMRWSDFPTCGEKKLICAVIALAIVDDKKRHELESVSGKTRFFGAGLDSYCRLIGLNSNFVCEQILLASSKVGCELEAA